MLTTKPILVREDFTVVKDWDTAVPGTITEGVVVKISDSGLLVQLWGELRGWVPKSQMSTETIDMPEMIFWLGQAVKCRVMDADPAKDKISLSLILNTMTPLGKKERRRQVLNIGQRYEATVVRMAEDAVEVNVEHEDKTVPAVIPFPHLTDTISMVPSLANSIKLGQKLSTMAWHKDVVTILTMKRSLMENYDSAPKGYEEYKEGSQVPGVVTLIKKFGVFLRLPKIGKPVLCPIRMLQGFFVDNAETLVEAGQTLWAKVIDVDSEAKKMTVSCSLENIDLEISGGRAACAENWLKDQALVRVWCPHTIGDRVSGKLINVTEFGAEMDVSGISAIVTTTNLPKEERVKEGQSVSGHVVFIDSLARVIEVNCNIRNCNIEAGRDLEAGDEVRGRVIMNKTEHDIILVQLSHPSHCRGGLGYLSSKRHCNDLVPAELDLNDKEAHFVVQDITARGEVLLVPDSEVRKGKSIKLGKRARNSSVSGDINIDGILVKKQKISAEKVEVNGMSDTTSDTASNKAKKKKKAKKDINIREIKEKIENMEASKHPIETIVESINSETTKSKPEKNEKTTDPGWDFSATCINPSSWKKASIWSDEELDEKDEDDKERAHVSKAEAKRRKRVEEELAASCEQRILEGEVAQPTTKEEFERLVVGSPDSSLVWVQYMALVMGSGELEAARAIAKRALERINFRLEDERLNIFLAWLNLENSFGTEEAMAAVLKETLQCCDQFKVYSQVAQIYSQSGKFADAERIHKLLVRKFNKEKEAWIKFGIFYYKNNKLNDGRFVLQRSLQSLDKRDHIEMSSKFAQVEFRYGESERGKTMFETILANFPKRTDLWSVYADQLVKIGDLDSARALFKRMSTLDLQAKKMKFLFKKWLDFESGHGTESGVNQVKQAAQKFLEGKGMRAEEES